LAADAEFNSSKTLPAPKFPRDYEDQMPDEKRRRFQDYLTREGFADVAISLEQFQTILSDATPGVDWPNYGIDAAFDEVTEYLSRAVGHWGWSSFNTRRQALRERLELLRTSLKTAAYILALSGDLREKIDIDLLGFITNVAIEKESDLTSAAMHRKYGAIHAEMGKMLTHVEAAADIMREASADGPARAAWYDLIVEGAGAAARSLAIPLTIGGDRDGNPHDTPFVRLVMGLESLLPSEMQSPSMAACAKRIERSPAWCLTR
jgi:hypothetical protein